MPGDLGMSWDVAAVTTTVGGTAVATYTATMPGATPRKAELDTLLGGIATAEVSSGSVTFTGVSVGEVTIPPYSQVGSSVYSGNPITISVTAPTEDESYLNKRGLTHFWENIDDIKQDKLTAGTNITISANNTISASQPTVGNATLTIQKNGTNVQTFTANATSNKTANITVPTKTSDLTNNSNFVADANYVHTDNNYTTTEKNKLAGIAAGAEVNVQANWAQTTTTAVDYIKNKPTLATVATSGSYNDLSNKPTIPTVNNATLTIQKNGTNVQTFTANQGTNATANITVPTNTNELTNGAGFITSRGTAAKANQLTTARTIAISGGVTGTATSFNGSSNISIPVTNVKDAYISWGGKNLSGDLTPDDMGCIDEFGHNKLAYLPAECIQVHYSTDGGTTWTDYGLTNAQKIAMVTTSGTQLGVGKNATITADNIANMRLRVRIASGTMDKVSKIYSQIKKMLINVSTSGAGACKVAIRRRTIANYLAGTETWTNAETYNVSGWSGWNSIPYTEWSFGGSMTTQTSQWGQIEFVFWSETYSSSPARLSVIDFRFIGATNWTTPSEIARAGHLYTMDTAQNATFPANVNITGSLGHNSHTYTLPNKNGTVAMTSDIPSVPTVNNGKLTIQKNGTNVATFTANQSGNATANITVPTTVAELSDASTYVTQNSLATQLANKQNVLTAGDHINITGSTIKAVDYVHSEQPVSTSAVTPVVTGNMISNGTITADKLASGATVKLTLSTSDIGEGAALAANTLYGVYQ